MNYFISVLLVASLLLAGAGCSNKAKPASGQNERVSVSSVNMLPFKSIDEYVPSDRQPERVDETLPQAQQEEAVKTGERASVSKNVIVSSLVEQQELGNPFIILGRARAFENVVSWRIRDAREKTIARGSVMTNAKDAGLYGSFRVRAFFNDVPETEMGFVEVYTASPRDGSDQDMVRVPVRFMKDRGSVKAFFSNVLKDPNVEHCDQTHPVTRRIVKTQNTAEAALLELLKGPTAQEQVSGSRTAIIPGTVLRSVKIEDGVATADFSSELAYGLGGSCRVQALIAQIDQTLKQFEQVKEVRIFIEGEDAQLKLQP